jgi:DNA-binding response OmpR family regulator
MSQSARQPLLAARVLVVEDEPDICELISDILQAGGLRPHCVQRDREAYEALRSGRGFACMVVDVNLGAGVTGYDLARFARTLDPALPVIYVSGQISEASFKANGVTGALFLPKPFSPGELMERVHMLVGDNDD